MTGEGAINRINGQKIDAMVLDIKLPDITGITIAKKVRKALPSLPIAFLTNYQGDSIIKECKEVNAFFWSKVEIMANPIQLYNCLEALITGEDCPDPYSTDISNIINQKVELSGIFRKSMLDNTVKI